ncbi:hypothetical protein [Paractinoplanes durhamensis]|nr:hypothetical protein [Actinoplanes durhamensis]
MLTQEQRSRLAPSRAATKGSGRGDKDGVAAARELLINDLEY